MQSRGKYVGEYNDEIYWERVDRNLGWLGNSKEEQVENQKKIRDCVIGIAGCGGIGGGIAEKLVRLGVRNLKLADPDEFDISNINRQLGATIGNVGRNKAEVVAEIIHDMTKDVNIDIYPEGICEKSADEFVQGCDYVLDKIDIYAFKPKYILHRAFRGSERCKFMMFTPVFGHRMFVFKYTKDSMPIEEIFELPMDADLEDKKVLAHLVRRLIPEMPSYPNKDMLDEWFVQKQTCPIIAGCPPISQGVLTERLAFEILGMSNIPGYCEMPVTPGYAMFDAFTWESKVVHDKWW